MGLKEDLKMMWNAHGTVVNLIKEWQPTDCKSEKDYERSLVAFLALKLPDIDVVPQYAIGRSKADICVHRSFPSKSRKL